MPRRGEKARQEHNDRAITWANCEHGAIVVEK